MEEIIDSAFEKIADGDKAGFMNDIETAFYNELGNNPDYQDFKDRTDFYREEISEEDK